MAKQPVDVLLDIIRAELGYREGATGWTKFGAWWAERHRKPLSWANEPWCDMLLSWAAAKAGLSAVVGDSAWTVGHAQWFKDRGQWGSKPRKGALVFYDWAGRRNVISAIDHVGFVEAVHADGTITTLEGNTSNQLLRRRRSQANVAGYGYPAYPTNAASKPVSPPSKPVSKPHPANPTEALVKKLKALRRGDKGWDVKTLYGLLYARGYPVAAGVDDTVFGDAAEDALKAFQKAAGRKPTGLVADDDWAALLRVA